MKFKTISLSLLLTVALVSCKSDKKKADSPATESIEQMDSTATENKLIDTHNSQNALDWAGTYTGVLPCADCPGIETSLTLNNDLTYSMTMTYQERDTKNEESGAFKWLNNGSTIALYNDKNEVIAQYKVGENQLFQLDGDGNIITGDIAKHYILKKIQE